MSPTQAEVARHYASFQVQTASHPKRIHMLHVRCTSLILMALDESNTANRKGFLAKAQKIISRLMSSLIAVDPVSKSLYYLYDYCFALLGRGTDDDCARALKIQKILRDTFEELLRTV